MTKTINICKADPIAKDREVVSVRIDISDDIPKELMTLDRAEEFYREQAAEIEKALFNSLPQAVYDLLLHKMMAKKVSLYRGLCG